MFGRIAVALVGALAASWAGSARAELYSWVDDDGVIHLTNVTPNANYQRYDPSGGTGHEAEGFGGEKPLVIIVPSGEERVVYPVQVTTYDDIFREAAEHYRLPFAFLKAVAKVESNFDPDAVSHADAKGLMQMIDGTAAMMNVADPFDPRQSIFGGARYLRILANEFDGNMALVAAAYNAGPERVRRLGRIPKIRETQRYVRRVLQMYRHYRKNG